jgi:hypothetical protein
MGKIFKLKNFDNFVWTPFGSTINRNINFCLQVHFKGYSVMRLFASGFFHDSPSLQPLKITVGSFQIFSKFTEIFASQSAPPVSTTPAANFAISFACVVDTGGKFATVSMTPSANLPLVSLTPAANNGKNQAADTLK